MTVNYSKGRLTKGRRKAIGKRRRVSASQSKGVSVKPMENKAIRRKNFRVGAKSGFTLPIDLLERNGIKVGDQVEVTEKDGEISIRKVKQKPLSKGISPDFYETLERNSKRYDEALKGLVER
ncbi:AbrB/MazE/SpoVT family DNA-binding domain-containing protein [Caldalkalibacillus salinus]|uniref:AbrB/MazE/SpoVT family DNA-binding domain-containing protein n=1 Tax=Caldalkalibacillus salinus TaxID=2803787 RepID=UPI001924C93C|nr:AbrB/MazE/SpoVT family DNA-binding domain-containing protein [Caldalkalibacillus salinus]